MAGRHSKRREVFLSHSSKDRRFVAKLAAALKKHGVSYWFSVSHIAGARQWHDEIGRALQRCNWFLVVLTPDSVKSAWVKNELLFALNNERYRERIIPVLLKRCNHKRLSWTISQFQFVDFTLDFQKGCRELLRVWKLRNRVQSIRCVVRRWGPHGWRDERAGSKRRTRLLQARLRLH